MEPLKRHGGEKKKNFAFAHKERKGLAEERKSIDIYIYVSLFFFFFSSLHVPLGAPYYYIINENLVSDKIWLFSTNFPECFNIQQTLESGQHPSGLQNINRTP